MFSVVSLEMRSSKAFFFNSDTAHYEHQPQMRQTCIRVQCWDVFLTMWANRYIDFGEHRGGSWGCTTFELCCNCTDDGCDRRGANAV